MANCIEFYPQVVTLKIAFVFEGSGTFILKWYSSVGSVLESSCHQLSNAYWNFVIIMKMGSENWVWRDLPSFERFSLFKKWSWTPTLFELKYLSSLQFKSIQLSAHQIENFPNFSKLTKIYSAGHFLVPLEASKDNRRIYFSSIVYVVKCQVRSFSVAGISWEIFFVFLLK